MKKVKIDNNKNLNEIKIYCSDDSPTNNSISDFFIILCGILGNIFFYTSMYIIEIDYFLFIFLALVINIVIFSLLTNYKDKIARLTIISILTFGIFAINFRKVIRGFESIIKKINYDINLSSIKNQDFLIRNADVFFAIIFYLLIITIILNIIVRYKQNFILVMLIMCPCLVGIVFGIMPPNVIFILYIVFMVSMISMSVMKYENKKKRKNNNIDIISDEVGRSKVGIVVLISCLMVFVVIMSVYPSSKYKRNANLDIIKHNIEFFQENMSLSAFKNIFGMSTAHGGIDDGKLGTLDKLIYDNKVDLSVSIPYDIKNFESSYDDGYIVEYLPAFRGDKYEGNEWTEVNENKVKKKMNDYDINNINYHSCKYIKYLDNVMTNVNILKGSCDVKNVDANRKYVYAPYNSISYKEYSERTDNSIEYYDIENSDYSSLVNCFDNYNNKNLNSDNYLDEYLKYESIYKDYVYKEYTKYPKELLPDIQDRVENKYNKSNLDDCVEVARRLCQTGTKYSLEPGSLPQGRDFIDYFYTENKKGYCSHFASTATVMLRIMGVPARYVEGYAIRYKDLKSASNIGEVSLESNSTVSLNEVVFKQSIISQYNMYEVHYRGLVFNVVPYNTEGKKIKDKVDFKQESDDKIVSGDVTYKITLFYQKDGLQYEVKENDPLPEGNVEYYIYLNPINEGNYSSFDKDISILSNRSYMKVNLTDASAHAWVEVYIDNLGWVPVDVTPSSNYDDTESKSNRENKEQSISNNSENNNNDSSTDEKNESKTSTSKTNTNKTDTNKSGQATIINITLIIVIFIVFIIFIIYLRRLIIIKKRKNNFIKCNSNKSVVNMYKYLVRIFEFLDIEDSNSGSEYVKLVEKYVKVLKKDDFKEIVDIAFKAKYSNAEITISEVNIMKLGVKNIPLKIYTNLDIKDRIKFKYIKALI